MHEGASTLPAMPQRGIMIMMMALEHPQAQAATVPGGRRPGGPQGARSDTQPATVTVTVTVTELSSSSLTPSRTLPLSGRGSLPASVRLASLLSSSSSAGRGDVAARVRTPPHHPGPPIASDHDDAQLRLGVLRMLPVQALLLERQCS
jgi:hypothetical protein